MRGAVQPLFEPIIAGFCETYPDIELEIYADDALADLSAGGFDAGVRMGESLDADVIAVRLTGPFRFVVAAAPAYLDRPGRPQTPEALRSEEHTSELQSLMSISYAVFCLKKQTLLPHQATQR